MKFLLSQELVNEIRNSQTRTTAMIKLRNRLGNSEGFWIPHSLVRSIVNAVMIGDMERETLDSLFIVTL